MIKRNPLVKRNSDGSIILAGEVRKTTRRAQNQTPITPVLPIVATVKKASDQAPVKKSTKPARKSAKPVVKTFDTPVLSQGEYDPSAIWGRKVNCTNAPDKCGDKVARVTRQEIIANGY